MQQAILRRNVAVDGDLVPRLRMADIIDRHIVMLAPEKRHGVERLSLPEHVARGGLALAFSNHPMLDPDIFPGMRIGPARDITGGINSGDAGFEVRVHRNAAIQRKAGLLRQC